MKHVTSRDNPLFKQLVTLKTASRSIRKREGRIVLDGAHLVDAYLNRHGSNGVELVVKESTQAHREIAALINRARVTSMTDALFDQAAPVKSPVGILALAPRPSPVDAPTSGLQILVDDVQDPGNLGAILRSAAAAGATAAHLSASCADPWSPKSLRGGMGAQFVLSVHEPSDLTQAARALDMPLIACSPSGRTSVFELDLRGDVAFIVGGEGAGISGGLMERADRTVRIPMRAGIESLNVAAASAVCCFEWMRQQGSRGTCEK